jgi:RNA polymerase sigma-70 factor (ECF subfamily)
VDNEQLQYLAQMDVYSLDEIMKQYGKDVWNYAYILTKNTAMADDITQDVFLQAYRNIISFRGEASLKTWLLRITHNISFNYRNTAFFRKVSLIGLIFPTQSSSSTEEIVLEQEFFNDIWQAALRLPAKLREVLVLEAKYELTLAEIADLLNISNGAVRSRLFRARAAMSTLLKGDPANE